MDKVGFFLIENALQPSIISFFEYVTWQVFVPAVSKAIFRNEALDFVSFIVSKGHIPVSTIWI